MKTVKFLFLLISLSFTGLAYTACDSDNDDLENGGPEEETPAEPGNYEKVLIVYFSKTNTTEQMAGIINDAVDSEMIELITRVPYPEAYSDVLEQAREEINSGFCPELTTVVQDLDSYDLIFIGYPIWHGTIPPPIRTFLTDYDLSGKTVVPFCTSGVTAGTTSFNVLKSLAPEAQVLEGLQVSRSSVGSSSARINEWLEKIGVLNQ